jgi:hypothetical protein
MFYDDGSLSQGRRLALFGAGVAVHSAPVLLLITLGLCAAFKQH